MAEETITKKTITLDYSNALTDTRIEFTGEFESVADAVRALVATFNKDFNPANIDFEHVVVAGEDAGLEGLYNAEITLKEFYS